MQAQQQIRMTPQFLVVVGWLLETDVLQFLSVLEHHKSEMVRSGIGRC